MQGLGCRVQGSGFRVQGSRFRIQGSQFTVSGLGTWASVGHGLLANGNPLTKNGDTYETFKANFWP